MQKLGINIDALDDFRTPEPPKKADLEDTIKIVADLGFGAIFNDATFGKNPQDVAMLCEQYKLEYQFIHAPFRGTNNLWLDNLDGDEMLKKITNCIDDASHVNVPIAVVHISSGYTPPPISEIGANRYKHIVEHAAEKNVKIAFENLRNHAYLEWAMDTFEYAPNVGFCWDTGHEHCFTTGIDYMPLYGNKLLCTHIHDNNCTPSGDLHLIPFDGKIDFEKVAKHLKNSGFDGPLMLEVLSKNEMYNGISKLDFYTKAYKSIEKIRNLIND